MNTDKHQRHTSITSEQHTQRLYERVARLENQLRITVSELLHTENSLAMLRMAVKRLEGTSATPFGVVTSDFNPPYTSIASLLGRY